MSITTNRTRRTAGVVSLLAALLLVLNALMLPGAAGADQPEDRGNTGGANPPSVECGGADWIKIESTSSQDDDLSFTLENYDWNNASAGDVIEISDAEGIVITIDVLELKTDKEAISIRVTLDKDADFTITEVVVKAGSLNDADGDTTTILPGESKVVTVPAELDPRPAISHITLCLGEVPDDPDPVDATPTGTLTSECGSWSATVAVSEGDQPTNVPVTFEVREGDTVIATTTLGAGEDDTLDGTFGEDTGTHALTLVATPNGGDETELDTAAVETDCEQPPTVAPAARTSIECETPFVTLDNSDSTETVVFQVAGAVEGGILEVPVDAGDTETVDVVVAEDSTYEVTISAEGMEDVTTSGTYDCEQTQVDPDTVVRPAVSFVDPTCDDEDGAEVVTIPVDGITYDVDGNVRPGGSVTVTAVADDGFVIPANQKSVWTHTFANPTDCVEVAPQVIEKPQPAPATEVESEQLAATGFESVDMLLLALLLMGLGGMVLLAPEPRRVR